ncbi:MAG: polysaccharide deacetylase family protein [Verrucomicrobiales bacterium]|nr:polysaccharide deacetylase family protein [Verrucomicrobiales bacterium]
MTRIQSYFKGNLKQPSIFDWLTRLGVMRILRPWCGGAGVIFVLHRVCRNEDTPLAPMFATTGTLENMLAALRGAGWDIVSLDELRQRLTGGPKPGQRPFAVFTFDDGYLDNLTLALPVFRKFQAPLTVYVCTGFLDRTVDPWWASIDRLIHENDAISVTIPGFGEQRFSCHTWAEKAATYTELWSVLLGADERATATIADLYRRYATDAASEMARIAMTWEQAAELAKDPLVTVGAHTCSHPSLPRLSIDQARHEMREGRDQLEARLGVPVRHFAYPFGHLGQREIALAEEIGFETATTTLSGNVFQENVADLRCLARRNFYEDPARFSPQLGARFALQSAMGCDLLVNAIRGRPRVVSRRLWS